MRSLLSCVFPCDHIDMIKLVHLNGHVQEIGTPVRVAQVIKAYPHHFVVQASYLHPGILHLQQPDAQLQFGQIYFLVPIPKAQPMSAESLLPLPLRSRITGRQSRNLSVYLSKSSHEEDRAATTAVPSNVKKVYVSKEYFSRLVRQMVEQNQAKQKIENTKEKKVDAEQKVCAQRRSIRGSSRRIHRVGSWRPALESILEIA